MRRSRVRFSCMNKIKIMRTYALCAKVPAVLFSFRKNNDGEVDGVLATIPQRYLACGNYLLVSSCNTDEKNTVFLGVDTDIENLMNT